MKPWHARWRRPAQWAVLALFAALPWLNRKGFHGVSGTLFSLEAWGLPLADPLAAVQVLAAGALPGARLLLGGLLVLAVAVALGRVFCSWGCPYGLLSELVHARRKSAPRAACAACLARPRTEAGPDAMAHPDAAARPDASRLTSLSPTWRNGFPIRAGMAAAGLALTVLAGAPLLNQLSLPGEITLQLLALSRPAPSAWDWPWTGLVLIAALLAAEWRTRTRLWCRYLCPQSVLLSLAARLWPGALAIRRNMRRCTCAPNDRACAGACSMGLDPRIPARAPRSECTNCGDCATACAARGGALHLGFREPPDA
ncbi:4Fe-4S binding protein [Nitratidesulfovibrio sp. D1]|uniref:4Fe-4S binding protein n=1 Tax=Nitratidesulfovibrio sp. D1 TaxID=3440151 RepID=UPI003EB790CE